MVLRVVMVVSFQPEEVAGIRKTADKYEVFAITPSSAIWDTYSILGYQSGKPKVIDVNGKIVPPEKNELLQELKRHAPSDYRQIRIHTRAAPISANLTQRVIRVWRRMLLDAERPKDRRIGADGATYRFDLSTPSAPSAEIWSPDEGTRTSAMVNLGIVLSKYAKRQLNEKELAQTLKELE